MRGMELVAMGFGGITTVAVVFQAANSVNFSVAGVKPRWGSIDTVSTLPSPRQDLISVVEKH